MIENELIGPIPENPAEALANWRPIRERIHERFGRAGSEQERVALLTLYCSTMNMAEKAIGPGEQEKFREIRGHGYSLLVVSECLNGDRLSAEKARVVFAREMESGRMARDHVLTNPRELARLSAEYIHTQQLLKQHEAEKGGWLARLMSWLHR
jgi:hypothetical protein